MEDETKLFYELTAEQTANEWYPNQILLPTIRDFVSLLPPRPRVLDLGCGPGYESLRLASVGADVVGVDFASESIRIARERAPGCRFELLDFRQLDTRFGMFDGVFAAASLIHISPEELPDVLDRVADVLHANGYLLTIVQHGEGSRERQMQVGGQTLRRVLYLYTAESLQASATRFRFVREGILAEELLAQGWRCALWQRI